MPWFGWLIVKCDQIYVQFWQFGQIILLVGIAMAIVRFNIQDQDQESIDKVALRSVLCSSLAQHTGFKMYSKSREVPA